MTISPPVLQAGSHFIAAAVSLADTLPGVAHIVVADGNRTLPWSPLNAVAGPVGADSLARTHVKSPALDRQGVS